MSQPEILEALSRDDRDALRTEAYVEGLRDALKDTIASLV